MLELSICEAVLWQVLGLVPPSEVRLIGQITLRIGPLAGVEPEQLRRAFPPVAAGTPCADAVIAIENTAVEIRCRLRAATSQVRPNRLLCAACDSWQVKIVSGDEMLLTHIAYHAIV